MKKLILLGVLATFGFLYACTLETTAAPTTTAPIATTAGYEAYGVIFDYDEIFNREGERYLVYLYSTSCSHCASLKSTVLAFAGGHPEVTFYSFQVTGAAGNGRADYLAAVGRDLVQVPALLIVVGHELPEAWRETRFFTGSAAIADTLAAIGDGTYQGWD